MTTEDGDIAALRDSLRRMLGAQYSSEARRRLLDSDRGLETATWQVLTGQLGLGALGIPEQYEGAGGTPEQSQTVHEELGAVLYSGPYLASNGLAVPALLCAGDEEARLEHLPRIADGSEIATLATTEAGRSWDVTDIETVAQADGSGGWVLTGVKSYVLDALDAGTILVSAICPDGIGLFTLALPNEAVTLTPTPSMDLTHRLCRVELDHAPATRVSGSADATQALTRARELSMIAITGEQVGGALACLAMAVEYAETRVQFGKPIGQFQAVKHMCADMLVEIEIAASLAHNLARAAANPDGDLALAASMAKAQCSDAYFFAASSNIQIHGGIGFTWEHDAHLYYRRAKSLQLMFGDAGWHRGKIADLTVR